MVSDLKKAEPSEGNAGCSNMNSIPRPEREHSFNVQVVNAIAITAGPMVLAWLRAMISVLFLSYLGEVELMGGFVAIGFANITGYSVISCIALGMEFLCDQAYEAKQLGVMGLTLQRTVLVLLCSALPIGFLWINMEGILLWCGQEEIIIKMAGVYITFSLPDLLAQAFLHPLRIYLTTQKITLPVSCCEALALLLHIPINLLLVLYLQLGIAGVALAAVWSNFNMVFSLVAYLIFSGLYREYEGFLSFQGCVFSIFLFLFFIILFFLILVFLFYNIVIYAAKYLFIKSFLCTNL